MEDLKVAFWLAGGLIVGVYILGEFFGGGNNSSQNNNNAQRTEKQFSDNSKIYKKIEKENLVLENMYIQKEEVENEIENLELESSMDFEKENMNSTKIKKLRLKIKHLDISIEDRISKINSLNNQLEGGY